MPAVRDFAQNYHADTAALGLVCSAPALATNDLLVAVVSADTGTQIWFVGEPVTYCYRDVAGTPTDYTAAANNETTGDVVPWSAGTPAVNDAFYVGSSTRFNCASFLISTQGAGTFTVAWEYYDTASTWTALPGLTDATVFTGTAIQRTARFTVPGDWATLSLQSNTLYWIRARISAYTSMATHALASRVWVGKWQQLFSATSTVNHGMLYKYATASEPTDYQITYTTAETVNGAIISIRDVDQKVPFSTTLPAAHTYNESNVDSYQSLNNTTTAISQSFAGTAGLLCSCKFYLQKTGSPTGNAVARLYTHSGSMGTSSVPTGRCLSISDTFDVSTLTGSPALIEFKFAWPYTLTATNWCIVLEYTSGTVANYVQVGYDASAPSHGGNKATYASAAWTAQSGQDVAFYCYNFTYTTGTATTSRSALPTMTTSRDNSLVLWACANATAVVPAILEGPCTFIFGKDGAAHSDGCSWGWQKTAGTTSNAVYQSNMGATTGQTLTTSVAAVQPPSTGATVIPAYCSADSSVYVSPLTGAAYNGDSVPVNTVTSVFGSTLNGVTLATGGTTYTRADVGINSYHAMTNFTGIVTAGQWAGIRTTILTRNLASKNLLFHVQPYLPVDIQTTDSVALTGAMGVAIGLSSTANTNYKVWHVSGAGTTWGVQRHMPVIINTDYTGAGMIQNSGTLVPGSIVELGFMVSGKVVAPNWMVGSCWALDTTTICGGIAAEPLNVSGIVNAAAYGKERRSVIQEGNTQFMIFGPVQIGNGGTNPVVLVLDGTALEFPKQYDKANKIVNYCSTDNVCGIKYYAGAGDTITHKNSVISSASRYFWGLHGSSSTSGVYDFTGLSVIGAGTITLAVAITISYLTINDYVTLDVSGATLSVCTIKNPPAANDSVTTSASTVFSGCTINVSTVTAGNRWLSVASPAIFTNCAFTGGGGYAIRITTAGTYAMTGNSFTSFGANSSTGAAIYNDSGGLVTINITGGASPTYTNGAGASTVINNLVAITITPLQAGSEVRIYTAGTATELAGIETSVGTSTILNVPASTSVDIVVLCYSPAMQPVRRNSVSFAASQSWDPVQRADTNFSNPV